MTPRRKSGVGATPAACHAFSPPRTIARPAMRNHDLSHDCLRTAAPAAVALLIAGGIGVAAAQKAPAEANPSAPSAPSAQVPQSGPAFVNGALAAAGADKDA